MLINLHILSNISPFLCIPACTDDESWRSFKDELVSYDGEKVFYPERCFEFADIGSVVLTQEAGDVGTIVWDAEVILAHYLHSVADVLSEGDRILELGGGTALASIVCARHGARCAVQEIDTVVPHTLSCVQRNLVNVDMSISDESSSGRTSNHDDDSAKQVNMRVKVFAAKWGADCVAKAHQISKDMIKRDEERLVTGEEVDRIPYDTIIMADVLYNAEYFDDLYATIKALVDWSTPTVEGGVASSNASLCGSMDVSSKHQTRKRPQQVILCHEQRRRDLAPMTNKISALFSRRETRKYLVESDMKTTAFYLHHFVV